MDTNYATAARHVLDVTALVGAGTMNVDAGASELASRVVQSCDLTGSKTTRHLSRLSYEISKAMLPEFAEMFDTLVKHRSPPDPPESERFGEETSLRFVLHLVLNSLRISDRDEVYTSGAAKLIAAIPRPFPPSSTPFAPFDYGLRHA